MIQSNVVPPYKTSFSFNFKEHEGDEELSSDLQTNSTMEIASPIFAEPEIEVVEAENKLSSEDLAKIKKVSHMYTTTVIAFKTSMWKDNVFD